MAKKKIWALVPLVLVILGIYFLLCSEGYRHYLDSDWLFAKLKNSQHYLIEQFTQRPCFFVVVYMLLYIVVCAFSLPISTVLSLGGGAIFGLGVGVGVISFSSSLGALAGFLMARWVMGEAIQKKYASSLERVNEGIERNGIYYLLSLRLFPIFPFFLLNFLMGLTPMPALKYYLVTQLGMLPANFLFVWAGVELASLQTVSDVLSTKIVLIFSLLGLFPLALKKIMDFVMSTRENSLD